jgi:glycosyltransferase involved in cell wall biosynthesis
MKITQVARRFTRNAWGGTETVVLESSRRLVARGHETSLLCPNALDPNPREVFDGFEVERFPYFYPYLGLSRDQADALDLKGGNLFSFSLMRRLLTLPAPDLYHLHTGKRLGGIVRSVARRRGVPYVVTVHGGFADVPSDERASWTRPTQGTLEWGKALGLWVGSRRVLEDAAHVICVGEGEAEALRRALPHGRVSYLPNGVETARFAGGSGAAFRRTHSIPSDRAVLLNVARIDRQKNQLAAVEILHSLRRRHDLHLVLIGPVTDPEYHDLVRSRVNELDLSSRVTLIPGLDPGSAALVDAYHAADVFVLPSIHEPFGIAVVEAWAAGLPIAAAAVGGIPHFVSHGETGILFDPRAESEATAAVDLLLSRKDTAGRIAELGRREARGRFEWDQVVDGLVDIYEEAVRGAAAHLGGRGVAMDGAA